MTRWPARVAQIGLSGESAAIASRHFEEVEAQFARTFGSTEHARAWWVPGRIEVLGKHTDYGGGRSLLCAVERGFHLLAAPRPDQLIHLVDASTKASLGVPLDANAEPRPAHWTDYPISVARRVARDFPGARTGMNVMLRSSLPSASGLSSSSALVIATFLPLAALNNLRERPEWSGIRDDDALAEYLGAMENGRAFGPFAADRGVGTQGGSEDQTAILRSVPGHLLRYHFVPVTHEGTIAIPQGWCFVIAMSGVHAAKGGAVQARYNALAAEVAALLELSRTGGPADASLFDALSRPGAVAALDERIAASGRADTDALRARLTQFAAESLRIIPEVSARLAAGDVRGIGALVAESQQLAEQTLGNQIPETVHLAHRAVELGAVAASAFGAGFGGSVWALVPANAARVFAGRWHDDYVTRFPHRRQRADFFLSQAGPPASEL